MKKGQVYLLAAIIIGLLLFTLVTPSNLVHQQVIDDDFEALSQNYQVESAKFLNEVLNQQNVDRRVINNSFLNFTIAFTSYSKTKNPNFGLIYAFPFGQGLFIGNYAQVPMDVTLLGTPVFSLEGCFDEVSTSVSVAGINLDVPGLTPSMYKDCTVFITTYPSDNTMDLLIENVEYTFTLDKGRSDIIVVSRESLGDDVKVFMSE